MKNRSARALIISTTAVVTRLGSILILIRTMIVELAQVRPAMVDASAAVSTTTRTAVVEPEISEATGIEAVMVGSAILYIVITT